MEWRFREQTESMEIEQLCNELNEGNRDEGIAFDRSFCEWRNLPSNERVRGERHPPQSLGVANLTNITWHAMLLQGLLNWRSEGKEGPHLAQYSQKRVINFPIRISTIGNDPFQYSTLMAQVGSTAHD